jgi:hypothetical protein
MKFEVEKETLEEVLTYLINRPYKEVWHLIGLLQQLTPLPEEKDDPPGSPE